MKMSAPVLPQQQKAAGAAGKVTKLDAAAGGSGAGKMTKLDSAAGEGPGMTRVEPLIGQYQVILATAGYDHSIRFWQAHTGTCLKTMNHTDSQVATTPVSQSP